MPTFWFILSLPPFLPFLPPSSSLPFFCFFIPAKDKNSPFFTSSPRFHAHAWMSWKWSVSRVRGVLCPGLMFSNTGAKDATVVLFWNSDEHYRMDKQTGPWRNWKRPTAAGVTGFVSPWKNQRTRVSLGRLLVLMTRGLLVHPPRPPTGNFRFGAPPAHVSNNIDRHKTFSDTECTHQLAAG